MPSIPADVLAAARTLAGLSQGGLASISGITRRTVVRAEQGLPIHERNRKALLEALDRRGVEVRIEADGHVVLRRRCPGSDGGGGEAAAIADSPG
jgi:transcriptional regulator with XRE-family HTH domain